MVILKRTDIKLLYKNFGKSDLPPFDLALREAEAYLGRDFTAIAGRAARRAFEADPLARPDPQRIAADFEFFKTHGLPALVELRSHALKPTTYQPTFVLPDDPDPRRRSVPAYPSEHARRVELPALASSGGPILRPPGFQPSLVSGRAPPRRDEADALEAAMAADHHAGRIILLPADAYFAVAAQRPPELVVDTSSKFFLVNKPHSDKGRGVVAVGTNADVKKPALAESYGAIEYPTIVELCAIITSTVAFHKARGVTDFSLYQTDMRHWFKRIRQRPEDVGLGAVICYVRGVRTVAFSVVEQFGSQDSNYHSNLGSACLNACLRARAARLGRPDHSAIYSDDINGALPTADVSAELAAIEVDATALAGQAPIAPEKTLTAKELVALGASLNIETFTVSMSFSLFIKLVCVLFLELPSTFDTTTQVTARWLQRAGSYMVMASRFIPSLAYAARGVYASVPAEADMDALVPLRAKAVLDLYTWRNAFRHFLEVDAAPLVQPIGIPPLVARQRDESEAAMSLRQSSAAAIVIHGDSCGTLDGHPGFFGLGFCVQNAATQQYILAGGTAAEHIAVRVTDTANNPDVGNNVYESLAAVVALFSFCTHLADLRAQGLAPPASSEPLHVHLFTDSSSALWWLRKSRDANPVVSFLVHVFSHLQVVYNLVVTLSHVPGKENPMADCVSRLFRTAYRDRAYQLLAGTRFLNGLPPWTRVMRQHGLSPSSTTSQRAADARTAAAAPPSPPSPQIIPFRQPSSPWARA